MVTANKALIAIHGTALARAAEAQQVSLCYEAAVAGGIPIVKALREGLAANTVRRVYGILNGTCNYILTDMQRSGRPFADVLAEAQQHGYAEADPSFDVDGVDAAHKLAILTSLAFGTEVDFRQRPHRRHSQRNARSTFNSRTSSASGSSCSASPSATGAGFEQRVHPCMVPADAPISYVQGVYNAIIADGDFSADTIYEGRGAGEGPTASAVVADLIDIARGYRTPTFGVPAEALDPPKPVPMQDHVGAYYVRLMVRDQPGVIADISAASEGSGGVA